MKEEITVTVNPAKLSEETLCRISKATADSDSGGRSAILAVLQERFDEARVKHDEARAAAKEAEEGTS